MPVYLRVVSVFRVRFAPEGWQEHYQERTRNPAGNTRPGTIPAAAMTATRSGPEDRFSADAFTGC